VALSHVQQLAAGSVTSTAAGTTLTTTFTGPTYPAAGDLVVIHAARDTVVNDPGTGDTFSDGLGNTYASAVRVQGAGGTASTGVATVQFFSVLTTSWSGTVTLTYGTPSVGRRFFYASHFTKDASEVIAEVGSPVSNGAASATSISVTTASVAVGTLVAGTWGWENGTAANSSGVVTEDTDTTRGSWSALVRQTYSGGGLNAANINLGYQHKITTTAAGTQTWDVADSSLATDHAVVVRTYTATATGSAVALSGTSAGTSTSAHTPVRHVQNLGTASSKTSASSLTVSFTGATKPAVGDLVVVHGARNNLLNDVIPDTLTDSAGNVYTLITALGSSLALGAGAGIVGVQFASVLTAAWPSGTNTITWTHPTLSVRAMAAQHFTRDADGAIYRPGVASGASTVGTPTASRTAVAGELLVGTLAGEHSATAVADADTVAGLWSSVYGVATTGGLDTENAAASAQHKAATAAGSQTFNPTTASTDAVALLAGFAWRPYARLTSSSAGASSSVGSLRVARSLSSTSAGTSATTGTVRVARGLSASTVGTSTSSGALRATLRLSGTSAGTSTSSASLDAIQALLGASAGTSTTTGTATASLRLTGSSPGTSATSASLRAALRLASTSTGTGTSSGALRAALRLLGTTSGTSTTSAVLSRDNEPTFTGASFGESSTSGTLTAALRLSATSSGSGTTAASAEASRPLVGDTSGTSDTVGLLGFPVALVGLSEGSSDSSGTLTEAVVLPTARRLLATFVDRPLVATFVDRPLVATFDA
jgi:hypothetical protein